MTEICNKDICTGCGLCATSCARHSITMKPIDNFGHLHPVINPETCTDCGLCQKLCPSLTPPEKNYPLQCFAAWSKDESDYKSSTSGGAASVLSQHIINKGGIVYGCAMLPNVEVKHIRIDNIDGLRLLKGSKYVQSDITEALSHIKKDIKNGLDVLFIGTPCQCAAVKNLFKTQPDNLYLVDLICHGVPSLIYLQKHIKTKIGTTHIDKVLFRDENSKYAIIVSANDKVLYKMPLKAQRYRDLYFNTFYDGYTYRDSCYNCKYACPQRAFDITIGDFWGLGKNTPTTEIPTHTNGCSVILPATQKGKDFVAAIAPSMNIYPREIKEAIDGNYQLQTPLKRNTRINIFRYMVKHGLPIDIYRLINIDKITKFYTRKVYRKICKK